MAGDLGQLKSGEWDQLQRYADRLEEAWKQISQGQPGPDLKQFLPPAGDALRLVVLHELVKTEMEIRWRHGLPTSLEHYLEKFPELGTSKDLPAALVFEEYRVRQVCGDRPPLAAYKIRFPGQFAELEKLHNDNPSPTAAVPTPPLVQPGQTDTQVEAAPQQQRPMASGGTVLPGGYKLLKRIGSGTFGEVWRAEAPGGVPCAVKIVIRPVEAEEAQRELHALELIKQLQHPFLMQTQRFETFEDRLYIVMELADGSLRDRLKQRRKEGKGGIPVPELIRYFRESAEALDFLHSEKVLHRDIKPENILILKGHAKVADFGLARGQGSGASMFSATGCGTPAYMAPEVWRGKVSHHTDQYSLAVAYAELRLDRRLFTGGDFMQMMMSHLEKTPDLSPLGEGEQKVLLQALSKDPTKRFATCLEFAEALEEVLAPELGKSGAIHIRKPSTSAQDLRVPDDSGDLGTVGRANLPSRRGGSSGERTEREGWRPGDGEPRPLWRSMLLLLSLFVPLALGGWYVWRGMQQNGPTPTVTFGMRDLPALKLRAGAKQSLQLNIDRGGSAEPLKISFEEKPEGLEIANDPDFNAAGNTASLEIKASPDLEPGVKTVLVRADCGDLHDTKSLQVTILPLATLPEGCQRAANAKAVLADGQHYYNRIEAVRGTTRVPFVLVADSSSGDVPTFYIMEDKVWVGLYRQFAKEQPKSVTTKRWEEAAQEHAKVWQKEGKSYNSEQLPVMRTDVEDADRFARWLGGRLQSQTQWDKAAGRLDAKPRKGPYLPPWNDKAMPPEVAVKLKEPPAAPLPVGVATRDISPYSCRDMSGNGLEWTRDANLGLQVPVAASVNKAGVTVYLRGWGFENVKPLDFSDISSADGTGYIWQETATNVPPDVGIRVVIEVR